MNNIFLRSLPICLIVLAVSFYQGARAQTDTAKVAQPDTTIQEKGKKETKRKDEFIVFAGVNLNQLNVSSTDFESNLGLGYHLGFDYKRGKFFYWQVGVRFNNAVYDLKDLQSVSDSADLVGVRGIDIPVTGGINFLSALNRIFALRIFLSAVPAFNLGVGENDLGITKDDINTFILYGQAGLGFNVAFFVLEAGYNFGFQDMLKDKQSKPGQIFVNLGFRF